MRSAAPSLPFCLHLCNAHISRTIIKMCVVMFSHQPLAARFSLTRFRLLEWCRQWFGYWYRGSPGACEFQWNDILFETSATGYMCGTNEPNNVQSTLFVIFRPVELERPNFRACKYSRNGRNMMKQKNVNCDNNANEKRANIHKVQSVPWSSRQRLFNSFASWGSSFVLLSRWNWMLSVGFFAAPSSRLGRRC